MKRLIFYQFFYKFRFCYFLMIQCKKIIAIIWLIKFVLLFVCCMKVFEKIHEMIDFLLKYKSGIRIEFERINHLNLSKQGESTRVRKRTKQRNWQIFILKPFLNCHFRRFATSKNFPIQIPFVVEKERITK